jgi:hypothetical protein
MVVGVPYPRHSYSETGTNNSIINGDRFVILLYAQGNGIAGIGDTVLPMMPGTPCHPWRSDSGQDGNRTGGVANAPVKSLVTSPRTEPSGIAQVGDLPVARAVSLPVS